MAAGMSRPAPCSPSETSAFPSHPSSQMASAQDASAFGNLLLLQCDSLTKHSSETSYMDTQLSI